MIKPTTTQKAFAYITSGYRILLLLHPDHPESGIQVPAGTIRSGEAVEEAAMREAAEETGLFDLELVLVLGSHVFDMRPFGRNELHERHFVHVRCHDDTPESWVHWESDPEGLPGARIRFTLEWASLCDSFPELIAGHGAFIEALKTAVGCPIPAPRSPRAGETIPD